MLLTEWNLEEAKVAWYQESFAEGFAESFSKSLAEEDREEGREKIRQLFLELLDQGLTIEETSKEIKRRFRGQSQHGLAKGREEERLEIVRNALAKGLPVETVQEITGVDIEFIQNIQAERI